VIHRSGTITRDDLHGPIDWVYFVDALVAGHQCAQAKVEDVFLGAEGRTLLSRAAWIEGLGFGVKSVTAMAQNAARGLPTVQGVMLLFDDQTGQVKAAIDGALVTDIKTASDSVLAARYLARPDSKTHLVIGAGSVAENTIRAYRQNFHGIETTLIWNRTAEKARLLADMLCADGIPVSVVSELREAAAKADIITAATMSATPVLKGDWVQPGTHVDLVGAFRADMREADDALLQKARIFVDSRETTLAHIGELKMPLASGTITEADVLADHYQLVAGFEGRSDPQDITVFKNGGGAHLDLMIADSILRQL